MPRVLKLNEIPRTYGQNAVWIEMRQRGNVPAVALYKYEHHPWLVFVVSTAPDETYLMKTEYNRTWRVWNRRPDPAELEMEKWKYPALPENE